MSGSTHSFHADLEKVCRLAERPAYALVEQVSKASNAMHKSHAVIDFHVHECQVALQDKILPGDAFGATVAILTDACERGRGKVDVRVEANYLAALQNLRNSYDYLAQVCNVLLMPSPIPVYTCDFNKILESLPVSSFQQKLKDLSGSEDFVYLTNLNNLTKHRWIISSGPHLDLATEEASHRLQRFEFSNKKQSFEYGEEGVPSGLARIKRLKDRLPELLDALCRQVEANDKGA